MWSCVNRLSAGGASAAPAGPERISHTANYWPAMSTAAAAAPTASVSALRRAPTRVCKGGDNVVV